MWLHRKSGDVTGETQVERVYNTVDNLQQTSQTGDINSVIPQSPSNSLLIWLDYPAITPEPMTRFISISLRLTPTASNVDYSVRVFSNSNIEVGSFVDQQGQQFVTGLTDTIQNRAAYTIQIASSSTIEFSTGDIEWIITSRKTIFNTPPSAPTFETSVSKYSNSSLFIVNQTLEFNITEQIPKMKIIDFLTGIFQMFNLTAYVENDIIVVQPLDEFYDKAPKTTNPLIIPPQVIPVNIDEYVDTTKSSVDIALPFSKVNFTYKGVGTFLAKQFNQLYNRVWGSNSYSIENDIYDTPSTEYKIEIPFEHMMYERLYNAATGGQTQIQYGYFVNENEQSYIGEPLIFYAYKQVNQTNIVIRNASVQTVINDYFIPMNSKHINPSTSKVNIHFNNFVNEYQANQTGVDALAFTDTLFQTQYSNYINEVFSPSRRLTKVTAFLPYKIFSSLQLFDRIEIGQKYYKINSMTTDLTTGKTDFELLNCDL